MALIRYRHRPDWDPFSWLSDFRQDLTRVFDSRLSPWGEGGTDLLEGTGGPRIDIYEDDENVVVNADLPGMKKEDIDISITGDVLTLKGEKKQEEEVKEENYHRIERSYGSFQRSITLPAPVEADKIKATYRDGVLEMVMPKRPEVKPKKIDVTVK